MTAARRKRRRWVVAAADEMGINREGGAIFCVGFLEGRSLSLSLSLSDLGDRLEGEEECGR